MSGLPFQGRIECVYEPAMTKSFLHGRTEAIRSVQPESASFVKVIAYLLPSNALGAHIFVFLGVIFRGYTSAEGCRVEKGLRETCEVD